MTHNSRITTYYKTILPKQQADIQVDRLWQVGIFMVVHDPSTASFRE